MKGVRFILSLCLILFCLTGCSVSDVNDIALPEIEESKEDSIFPPEVYEYDSNAIEDAETLKEKIKTKAEVLWNRFITGF